MEKHSFKLIIIILFVLLVSIICIFLKKSNLNLPVRMNILTGHCEPAFKYNGNQKYENAGKTELLNYLKTGNKEKLNAAEQYFTESEKNIEDTFGFYYVNPWLPYVQHLKGEYDGPDLIREVLPTKDKVISYLESSDKSIKHRLYYHIRPERGQDDRIEKINEAISVKKGSVGADIGCGCGYHVFYFSKVVGSNGMVYAIDVEGYRIDYIKKRAVVKGIKNIITVKSERKNICMHQDSLDWAFMFDVYHCVVNNIEKENSKEYFDSNIRPWLESIRSALKPGARIAICDRRRTSCRVTSQVNPGAIKRHMRKMRFKYVTMFNIGNTKDFYCIVFEK